MRKTFIFLIFIITVLASCTPKQDTTPSDFSLTLAWNTGSLPPEYTYSYEIVIGPGLEGTLAYQFGYDSEDEVNAYSSSFPLAQEQLDELYTYFLDQDILRSDWEEGEGMLGSPGSSLTIIADGIEYAVPSLSDLTSADYALVEEAIDKIKAIVPADLWEEMEARRQIYEDEYEY